MFCYLEMEQPQYYTMVWYWNFSLKLMTNNILHCILVWTQNAFQSIMISINNQRSIDHFSVEHTASYLLCQGWVTKWLDDILLKKGPITKNSTNKKNYWLTWSHFPSQQDMWCPSGPQLHQLLVRHFLVCSVFPPILMMGTHQLCSKSFTHSLFPI